MAKRLRCFGASIEKPIRLDVGGRIFDVGMETINSFQYLQARLGDNFQSPLNEAGELFVDRCPELFEVLLQSVRSLTRPSQRHILERKPDLLAECEFADVFLRRPARYPKSSRWQCRLMTASRSSIYARLCHGVPPSHDPR